MPLSECVHACVAAPLSSAPAACQVGKWTSALGARKFMGGDRPNLAGAASLVAVFTVCYALL
jgi:hypothetical protein